MKRILFISTIIILSLRLSAQRISAREDTSIYVRVDKNPAFPGGVEMFDKYINENANKVLRPDHATGIVIVEVLIEKTGKIIRPPGIIEGLTRETDSTAINLLKKSPSWTPGIKNGLPVRTLIHISVMFNDPRLERTSQSVNDKTLREAEYELTIDEPWPMAEEIKDPDDPFRIYISVDKAPEFPGGVEGFNHYVADNVKLRGISLETPRRATLSFIVERDGQLTDIKIYKSSLSNECDDEALRLLKQSPRWEPGVYDGRLVRTEFVVPVDFK